MTGHADKYYLLSNDTGESLLLDNAPVGWDATRFNILRDAIYLGVIKTISVEFHFVGEAFNFLQRHRLLYGMDASILFRVYRKDVYLVGGKVNFENFYEDRKFNKFRVDIVQGTFHQKFTNNEDVKLNILNNISLDRQAIDPAAFKDVTFRGKTIKFFTEFEGSSATEPLFYHHTIPFFLKINGNPYVNVASGGLMQVDRNEGENGAPQELPAEDLMTNDGSFYTNTLPNDQVLNISWSMAYSSTYWGSGTPEELGGASGPPFNVPKPGGGVISYFQRTRIALRLIDVEGAVVSTIYSDTKEGVYGNHILNGQHIVTVPFGHRLVFTNEQLIRVNDAGDDIALNELANTFLMSGGPPSPAYPNPSNPGIRTEYTYDSLSLIINQNSEVSDSVHAAILPWELFQTLISQINGGRFISNYFGRTELGYYEDGEGAYIAITTGEILRGIDPNTVQINTSFRDAFKSYNAIRCLGAIIGEDYIRIEPLDDLFNYEIAADIGEVREFAITPAKDFIFNSIKAGFPNNEYEQENGRDEFNTTYQYTNGFQSVKRELDLVSVYCGDGYGIEFARRANISLTGTADSRYDAKIFLICCKLDDYGDLVTKRDEDVLFVSGIFSPTTAYNLDIAVGQNMLRWKRYLNIPLYRKAERKLFFQGKDKEAGMQLVTDLGISNDGEDISLDGSYYFLPEERRFQCPIHIDTLFAILANPLGLVKYTYKGESFYDLIYELDSEVEKAATQWRVLGTKASPIEETDEPTYPTGPILKYGSRLADYVKYSIDEEGFVLYAGGSADDGSIPIGQLLFRGFVPTITIANVVNVTPSVGVGLFTGYAPSVFGAGGVGVALWTGLAPTVVIDVPGGEGLATLGGDFLQTLDDEYIIELP